MTGGVTGAFRSLLTGVLMMLIGPIIDTHDSSVKNKFIGHYQPSNRRQENECLKK